MSDELPSFVLVHLAEKGIPQDSLSVSTTLSAQQQVFIVKGTFDTCYGDTFVIRLWKNASRWWNLNQNDPESVPALARSEVAGYRVARHCLPAIHIPRVLYYCEGDSPWAILEYVGVVSVVFEDDSFSRIWVDSMVKERKEFGFLEPHPRWGRVPESQSLAYALMVLTVIVIPLHKTLDGLEDHSRIQGIDGLSGWKEGGYTYKDMVQMYKGKLDYIGQTATSRATADKRIVETCSVLRRTVLELENVATASLRPVLCHMDYQPQNLIFHSAIASVLDWEEAAYADPRFDLLLLCRKVCANRKQAQIIWDTYSACFPEKPIGRLAEWLKLETVHSLTTLLLQSMDLLGGGRSPWESKPDLWGKIEREIARLERYV